MSCQDKKKQQHLHYPFWFGGSASCAAACVTHPLDLAKVRMQTSSQRGTSMFSTLHAVRKFEGVRALYSGLTASLLRQATYSTVRFGIYEELKNHLAPSSGSATQAPPFHILLPMAAVSGYIGAIAGNPADVVNVRMQNDRSLPVQERRRYRHAIDGLLRMWREEGLWSWMRGVNANCVRGVLMTTSQLATYDEAKRLILGHTPLKDGLGTHFAASLLAGLVATTVCSPVDVVKSHIMAAQHSHASSVKVLTDAVRKEGVGFLFRGWTPSFVRLGPHTVVTFLVLEQQKKVWKWCWHGE
ncbi:Mitochondrial dicarboxylate transporter [Saitoella coloradoensis]